MIVCPALSGFTCVLLIFPSLSIESLLLSVFFCLWKHVCEHVSDVPEILLGLVKFFFSSGALVLTHTCLSYHAGSYLHVPSSFHINVSIRLELQPLNIVPVLTPYRSNIVQGDTRPD